MSFTVSKTMRNAARNYHHVYSSGAWEVPLAEHIIALRDAGFEGQLRVGIVGPHQPVVNYLTYTGFPFTVCAHADQGWEHVTLEALRAELAHHDGPILYTHTKGAANPSGFNDMWRRSMTSVVVADWRECVAALGAGCDAVGSHWLKQPGDVLPDRLKQPIGDWPCFGGNFWWATSAYLRTLPSLSYESRYDAEAWVGQNSPKVMDLSPGWPAINTFRP